MWIKNGWKQNLIQLEGKSEKQFNWKTHSDLRIYDCNCTTNWVQNKIYGQKKYFGKKIRIVNLHFRAEKFWIFALKIEQKLKILEFWLFLACKFKLRNQWITIFFSFLAGKFKFTVLFIFLIFYKLNFWTQFENYSVNR